MSMSRIDSFLHRGPPYSRPALLCFLLLALAACSTRPYEGTRVDSASFLGRQITQNAGDLVVSAAVPDADETRQLTGLDLYEQGVQPVWLKVENRGDTRARVALWSIDKDYFSPIEVAYMNRKKFSGEGYANMERWFYDNGMPRFIPPGESRSGLVFTNLRPGTKGFNLAVFNEGNAQELTFFVPLPGFTADFMNVDFANLYTEDEMRDFDLPGLRAALETETSCCTTDKSGELDGGPLNTVLVGNGPTLRRAMLRGGWLETSTDEEIIAVVRQQYYRGRPPDAIYYQPRLDGNEKIELLLWKTPWSTDGETVWIGQVFYFTVDDGLLAKFDEMTVADAGLRSFFLQESVMPDIDGAQRFLLQNIWYTGSLKLAGFVEGVGESTIEQPMQGFGGAIYFTDGWRLVILLSEEYRALDEGEILFHKGARYEPAGGGQ